MRVLINFGRTRSYIDKIRYVTNNSSGLMGYYIYQNLIEKGHSVLTVAGDLDFEFKPNIYANTNEKMYSAIFNNLKNVDIIICAAALNDYKLNSPFLNKISKKDYPVLTLEFVPALDVLYEIGKLKTNQFLIGFSAQDNLDDINYAHQKLLQKNLDLIAINLTSRMGQSDNEVLILKPNLSTEHLKIANKKIIANQLVDVFINNYLLWEKEK